MKMGWHYIANWFSRSNLVDCGHHLSRRAIGDGRLDDQNVVFENHKHAVVINRSVFHEICRWREFGNVEIKAFLIAFDRSGGRSKVGNRQGAFEITLDTLQVTRDY